MDIQVLSDEKILDVLGKDPQKGMVLLMEKYTGLVWHVISFHVENPEDIKECTNDTFSGFYFKRKRFDPERGSLPVYLTAIARKIAISRYRKEKLRRSMSLDESALGAEEGREDRRFNRAELKVDMERAMSVLKPNELKIIRMKYYDGMTVREIAESLDLPYETVKKRHQRGILKLGQSMLMLLLILVLLLSFSACVYGVLRYLDIIPPLWVQEEEEEDPEVIPDDGLVINNDQGWRDRNREPEPGPVPEEENDLAEVSEADAGIPSVNILENRQEEEVHTEYSPMEAVIEEYTVSPGYGVNLNPEEAVYSLTEKMVYEDQDYTLSLDEFVYINNEVVITLTLQMKDTANRDEPVFNDYILEYNGSSWKFLRETQYQPNFTSRVRYVQFEDVSLPASEQGLQALTLKIKGCTAFVFDLSTVKQDEIKDHPYQVGKYGGVMAIPRLEDGSLIVEIHPLDDDDEYKLLPGLIRDSAGGLSGDVVTVTGEDGTERQGRCLWYSPWNIKTYFEWDFGAASPGKYTLHVPSLCYERELGDEFTITIDLENNTWDSRKYPVHGGSVYLKECKLLSGDPEFDKDAFEEFFEEPFPDIGDKDLGVSLMECRSLKLGYIQDDPELSILSIYALEAETDPNPEPEPERDLDLEWQLEQEQPSTPPHRRPYEEEISLLLKSKDPDKLETKYLLRTSMVREYVKNAYLRFRKDGTINYRWNQSFDITFTVS